jgi:hypothetical protein
MSFLAGIRGRVCKVCSQAGDVDHWQVQLDEARTHLHQLERDVTDHGDEAGRRLGRRSAATQLERARRRERRATFRWISAQLVSGERPVDPRLLGALAEAREASAFSIWEREDERRFAAYVAARLEGDRLNEDGLAEIVEVCDAMTRHSDLSARELERVQVDISIALANGDVFLPVQSPPGLVLAAGECAWMCTPAGLCEPSRIVDSRVAHGGLNLAPGLGARVSLEQAHTITTERPGAFHETTNGFVAVTDRKLVFLNGRTLSIALGDVVGLAADRDRCLVHHSGAGPSPVLFRAPGWGSLVMACTSAALRRLS